MTLHARAMRRYMKRKGLPIMTVVMRRVLRFMLEQKQRDYPWLYLDEVQPKTLAALLRNGWIIQSPANALDRTRYTITRKGLQALEVYGTSRTVGRPATDICPRCKTNPKRVWGSGRQCAYCKRCNLVRQRKARQAAAG